MRRAWPAQTTLGHTLTKHTPAALFTSLRPPPQVNSLSTAAGPADLEALRSEVLDVRHQLAALASGRMERRAAAVSGQPPSSPRESMPTGLLFGSSASPAPPTLDRPLLRDSASRVSGGGASVGSDGAGGGGVVSADLEGRVACIEEGLRAALVAASLKEVDTEAVERKVGRFVWCCRPGMGFMELMGVVGDGEGLKSGWQGSSGFEGWRLGFGTPRHCMALSPCGRKSRHWPIVGG